MTVHTILVIDDNATTRRMVKNALTRRGHRVVEAVDGRTALLVMASERPRVVIQDLMLPDVDGFELVVELRKLAGPEVSFLAFSGFVSKLDEARVSSVGFDDIIAKPIGPARLVPLVEAHLPLAAPHQDRFGAGRRLVIADDDPMQLKLAAFRLSRLGFEVETVADGVAALDAIRRKRPDAVVSDVMMPELDGFALAMALRQDPALRTIPLVLVTSSYVEPSDRELARRAGANDLVVRTPELGELTERLRTTLAGAGEPLAHPEADHDLERERNRRVLRQLERQVMVNTGLAARCSALASELTVLTGIAETVLKHRDVDVAIDEALGTCFDAGGVSVGALYLLDEAGRLRARAVGGDASWSTGGIETFFGRESLLRTVIGSGQVLQLPSPDVPGDIASALLRACEATSLIVVPLTSATAPLGALLMVSRGRELDPADWRAFAQGVGSQISQVLTLVRAYADREAAEQSAARHAAVLAAVVESAPDHVLQLDRDGIIRFINRIEPPDTQEGMLGTSWFERLTPDQRVRARALFDQVIATGEPAEVEILAQRPSGAPSWFHGRFGAIKQDGAIIGCVLVARDVTDKKHTEMQLMLADRMASVGTLAAGVAHEINNPLASVIANLEMAADDVEELRTRVDLPKDLVEELRDARASAERVREIVRDLKVFSRVREDHREAVDVEQVLESTLRMAWNEIRHRARLIKQFAGVPAVEANESRLGQVFLNLIINAAQSIPEGKQQDNTLRVVTEVVNDQVVVTIADTGCGIPDEIQPRMFTPFFTTKPVGVGTGLGLAISHGIVTGLGGSISFASRVGEGTTFRVMIPVAHGARTTARATAPPAVRASRRGRVLVIDDEEPLAHALRRLLATDHDVEAVTSGQAAIDRLAGGARYDVILCDLMMPQVTGMDVHAAARALDPEQADKMVFVTGGAFTGSAREFLDAMPNRRLEKPFDLKQLRELVGELVK